MDDQGKGQGLGSLEVEGPEPQDLEWSQGGTWGTRLWQSHRNKNRGVCASQGGKEAQGLMAGDPDLQTLGVSWLGPWG